MHTQSLLPLLFLFVFFASVPLLCGFTWTLLFRCWFIRFNLDINHFGWWMMHSIFFAMLRTSKCWHHMGRRVGRLQSICTHWKWGILETARWLRWVISAYFLARLFMVAARHLCASFCQQLLNIYIILGGSAGFLSGDEFPPCSMTLLPVLALS